MDKATRARFEVEALPHIDSVYRVARALTRDRAEVDDLVQETFVRAFRGFDKFELREYGAKPWLLRILHNVFYTARSKRRRAPTLLDDVDFDHFEDELSAAELDPVTADTVDWDQMDEELKLAVASLQPEYRSVLLLWSMEGLTYKQIATACDCPIGTVMSRLYRARQVLWRGLRIYAKERKLDTQRFES